MSARGCSVKRFELSNRLDTLLHKNKHSPFTITVYIVTSVVPNKCFTCDILKGNCFHYLKLCEIVEFKKKSFLVTITLP